MLGLQEIYDRVADAGWDVTRDGDGFRLTPPDGDAVVAGPSSRSDERAIAAMVAQLERAGLDPDLVDAIDPAGERRTATTERPARRYSVDDARDERRKRHERTGATMTTTGAGDGETTEQRIARLERELEAARADAARESSVGSAEAVAEWFRSGKEPSLDDWVAVLSAAPDDAVRAAGYLVRGTTRPMPAASSPAATRAPRLAIDDVAARLPSAPFTVADLAARIDREVATARNYIPKLLEAGVIVEAGEDASGPGRAAKLYARA